MGIDNDYDGVGNADDPTPNGPGDKLKNLMQALADLLSPHTDKPASGGEIVSAGQDANVGMLHDMMGGQGDAPAPGKLPSFAPENPTVTAINPETGEDAGPAMPLNDKSPAQEDGVMGMLRKLSGARNAGTPEAVSGAESDETAPDAEGGTDAEEDAANGPPIMTKAKSAMSKLAKARGGK